ncbi:MAG: TatD family hydrolase, partial [Prevotella sp.]|nr:TatD family hydrolase [Prevotella sp.]
MAFIDTHCHLDGEEFNNDRDEVMQRAREAGCKAIFLPAIDLPSSERIVKLCQQHPGFLFPMIGLHPEEVRADWRQQLNAIKSLITQPSALNPQLSTLTSPPSALITSIGEVGLDFYWSREFEQEQMLAFEEQVKWSVETRLPLMIHCRKAQ